MNAQVAATAWPSPSPSALQQLRIWAQIGLNSFGGGQATQLLIYRAFVEERRWMSEHEYARAWSLCQVPPGINLIALAILIGRRLDGVRGLLLALTGLLVPSVLVTVVFTAVFAAVRGSHLANAGLRGMIAGVAGIGILMAIRIALPLLKASAADGRLSLAASATVLLAAVVAFLIVRPTVVVMFLAAGMAMIALGWARRRFGEHQP